MTKADEMDAVAVNSSLAELRRRLTVSLHAFNDTAPQAFWLRRSEIARITEHAIRTADLASRRRPSRSGIVDGLALRIRSFRTLFRTRGHVSAEARSGEVDRAADNHIRGVVDQRVEGTADREQRALASVARTRR